jgi:hypothetical protein
MKPMTGFAISVTPDEIEPGLPGKGRIADRKNKNLFVQKWASSEFDELGALSLNMAAVIPNSRSSGARKPCSSSSISIRHDFEKSN